MRLFLASVFTLLLLSGFLATIIFAFMFATGYIDEMLLVAGVIAFNFLLWLASPKISDFIYRWFFKVRWIDLNELRKRSKASADFIEATCKKYKFNVPKLGIIDDKNPDAFTYGSGRWNARIIITEGIFKYLDSKNICAVYGHELGHIKNRDFIVMTAASTILQLLYVMYIITIRTKGSKKGSGYLAMIGIASFIFYWIGQYIVLYLSRIREYYADQFSALETKDPNSLSVALVRIAYGILVNPDDVRLVNTTKHIGIMDFSAARSIGMNYHLANKRRDKSLIDKAFLFDLHNPWAFVQELFSTHPLTGKRVRRLGMLCKALRLKPVFDFAKIEEQYPVDKARLRANFAKDFVVAALPVIVMFMLPVFYVVAVLYGFISFQVLQIFQLFSLLLVLLGISLIIKTLYKYPGGKPGHPDIIDLMGDIYASPVRGKRVILTGKFIGRGVPGFIFSEDLMMEDKTGLIYLNYENWFPLFGNLFFAWRRVKKLIGRPVFADGWFLRGMTSRLDLSSMKSEKEVIKSYIKAVNLFWGSVILLAGIIAGIGAMLINLIFVL